MSQPLPLPTNNHLPGLVSAAETDCHHVYSQQPLSRFSACLECTRLHAGVYLGDQAGAQLCPRGAQHVLGHGHLLGNIECSVHAVEGFRLAT